MPPIFVKLNLKAEAPVFVFDAPAAFEPVLAELGGVTVARTLHGAQGVQFALAFVTTRAGLTAQAQALTALARGDAKLWFAYPKKSSKRHACEFNRDSGWDALAQAGYEPVRMVSIDEDWSALRFRRSAFVKPAGPGPRAVE